MHLHKDKSDTPVRVVWDGAWHALNLSIVPKETAAVEYRPPALKILTEGELALTIHVL